MVQTQGDATRMKLSGFAGHEDVNADHDLDDEIFVVARMKIGRLGHQRNADGKLIRTETAVPIEAYIIDAQAAGSDVADLLHQVRAERKKALDEMLGRQSLFDDDDGDDG